MANLMKVHVGDVIVFSISFVSVRNDELSVLTFLWRGLNSPIGEGLMRLCLSHLVGDIYGY